MSHSFSKSCSYTGDSVRANMIKSQASCRDRRQFKRALNVYVRTYVHTNSHSQPHPVFTVFRVWLRNFLVSPFPWYSRETSGESSRDARIVVEEITGVYGKTRTHVDVARGERRNRRKVPLYLAISSDGNQVQYVLAKLI